MTNTAPYRLIGGNGSPYSMKMRAIMRYRRLPFIWQLRTAEVRQETAHLKPQLVPILQLPEDGSYHLDSTPLAHMLEERHPGERSILPDDPLQHFLCCLLEDMGDEWLTKMMFHYRWYYPADQEYSAQWIIHDARPELQGEETLQAEKAITDRQVGRMAMVGCTPENAPILERGYLEVLDILSDLWGHGRYFFGSRPSLADFAWFGQLKTLGDDLTPMAIMRARAPKVSHWLRLSDDLSGIEGEWRDPAAGLPEGLQRILAMAGEIYLPFLAANDAAFKAGEDEFSLQIYGQTYSQGSFRYQVKCLDWLRALYRKLPDDCRDQVDGFLNGTPGAAILRG